MTNISNFYFRWLRGLISDQYQKLNASTSYLKEKNVKVTNWQESHFTFSEIQVQNENDAVQKNLQETKRNNAK